MKSVNENDCLIVLLARVASKDRAAFGELYEKTAAKLFGIIIRVLGKGEVAEDVLQESFLTIWQKAGSFDRTIASPITWMVVIARNKAIDFRRLKSEKISSDGVPLDDKISSLLRNPEQEAQRSDELNALLSCLGELLPEHKEMILLAYIEGWSRKELSDKFNHPVATIKTNLRRSLAALKGCLDG